MTEQNETLQQTQQEQTEQQLKTQEEQQEQTQETKPKTQIDYLSIIENKLTKRESIQITPWNSITQIQMASIKALSDQAEIHDLQTQLYDRDVFINTQSERLTDAANKIAKLETSIDRLTKQNNESNETIEMLNTKIIESEKDKNILNQQIEFLKNELSFARKNISETTEKMRQVNYENHRLLDIIGDLKKQIERNLTIQNQQNLQNQRFTMNVADVILNMNNPNSKSSNNNYNNMNMNNMNIPNGMLRKQQSDLVRRNSVATVDESMNQNTQNNQNNQLNQMNQNNQINNQNKNNQNNQIIQQDPNQINPSSSPSMTIPSKQSKKQTDTPTKSLDFKTKLQQKFRRDTVKTSSSIVSSGLQTSFNITPARSDIISQVPMTALRNIHGHTGDITSMTFSSTGDLLVTGSEDRTVRVWDASTTICKGMLRGMSQSVTSMNFSPTNDFLLVTSNDATIRIFDMNKMTSRYTLTGHSNRVTGGKFIDQNTIVTGSNDRTLKWWDVSHSRCKLSCPTGSAVTGLCTSRNQVITSHVDGTVKFWDDRQKDALFVIDVYEGVACNDVLYFDNFSETIWTNGKNNCIYGINPLVMKVILKHEHEQYINPGSRLSISPDGYYLTVGNVNGSLLIWDVSSNKFKQIVQPESGFMFESGNNQQCLASAWNPMSGQLVSGYGKNMIVWDN